MIEKLERFRFSYEVRYRIAHSRIWRQKYVFGDGIFMMQYAGPSEAQVAFRVSRRYKELPSTYEIISVGNDLFWPIIDQGAHVQVSEFLRQIGFGNSDHIEVLHGESLPSAESLLESLIASKARIDPSHRRDELLAKSQRGGSQLLAYNDLMYLRGGEPVYVVEGPTQCYSWHKDPFIGIKVADSHSRRQNKSYGVRGLGSYEDHALDAKAKAGQIFRADELMSAECMVADHRSTIRQEDDTIEIVNWNNILTDPLDLHVEACICSLNSDIKREISEDNPLFEGTKSIRRLKFQEGFRWHVGAAAIVEFINWCEWKKIAAGSELYDLYRYAVLEIDGLNTHCTKRGVVSISSLDKEDYDAIATLVT